MDLFTYLLGKKGQNTQRDLFSYLLGKGAGGSGTYVNFSGTSLNISNTLRARIKNIELKGATSQDGTPTPDTPIPIKVVTGEQNISKHGKNLANISILGQVPTLSTAELITYTNGGCTDYIEVDNTKEYIFSFLLADNTQTKQRYILFYDESKQYLGYISTVNNGYLLSTNTHFKNAKYIRIRIDYIQSFIWLQLEQNSIATSYEPYITINYPLSLGNLELAKIGDYQDYIYGSPNNWYKHEIIKKTVITNNTIINKITSTRYNIKDDIDYYFSGDNSQPGAISNYYISRYSNANGSILSSSTYNAISVYDDRFESVNDFRTWAIQNLIIYRILSTAREIQITDTTLIEQLNNLYNATSQDGTTIITCSSGSSDNETIVFSGDIKVASVGLGNSLNTSLLSSNIQEETNVDEVNEIEDIEQNNEPIEEPIEEEVS